VKPRGNMQIRLRRLQLAARMIVQDDLAAVRDPREREHGIDGSARDRAHGRHVNSIAGRYITAEDVGTSPSDMEWVRQETEYVVGLADGSGGTDSHLLLVDLRSKQLTGKEAQATLDRVGIHINKNTVPGDPQSPFVTSGIRIGTAALTTRGMAEAEMQQIGELIDRALRTRDDEGALDRVHGGVRELAAGFALFFLAGLDRYLTFESLRERHALLEEWVGANALAA
jgi:hypothetical protein